MTAQWAAGRTLNQRLRLLEAGEQVAKLGSWEWLPRAHVLIWSDNLYRLFGLDPGEIAPSPDYVLAQTHPDDRERVADYLVACLARSNETSIEYRIAPAGRGIRHLRSTITTVDADAEGAIRLVGAVQDVTDERYAVHELAMHVAAGHALTDWDSVEEPVRNLLAGLARAVEAVFAAFWLPRDEDLMAPETTWREPSFALEEFESATLALRVTRNTLGLPALAWRSMRPTGVADVSEERRFKRWEAAKQGGLSGAVAFPALCAGEVLAVIELFARHRLEPSDRREQTLLAIGEELGEFLSHRRGQLGVNRLTARQRAVLQLAAEGRTTLEIAQELGLGASTVRTHFDHIYTKLGVADRGQAIAVGVRVGLIR